MWKKALTLQMSIYFWLLWCNQKATSLSSERGQIDKREDNVHKHHVFADTRKKNNVEVRLPELKLQALFKKLHRLRRRKITLQREVMLNGSANIKYNLSNRHETVKDQQALSLALDKHRYRHYMKTVKDNALHPGPAWTNQTSSGKHATMVDDNHIDKARSKPKKTFSSRSQHHHSLGHRRGIKDRRFLSKVKSKMSKMKQHVNLAQSWMLSSKEAKELFDKYYVCLKERVEVLKAEEFPIKAFLAIEGEKLMLECQVCYRPDEDAESQKAKWQVLRHEDTAMLELRNNEKFKISKDNSLVVKDIDIEDAGQYFCVERHDYAAIYQLDVFLTDRRKHIRLGQEKPRPETLLKERNLRVFTMWAPWGECNTCDREGQKMRVGQCMVKKIYQDLPVFPRDYPLMVLYPEGVPCHSTALPRHIRKLQEIGSRYSETLVSPCQEPCPTEPPAQTITDETGKVVEVLEPGFHSMKEKPVFPKMVKRKVLYEMENTHLVLKCPGDLDAKLVRWARGEREVDPASIKRLTQNRVWIDSVSRLHLKPLLLSDTAVYNCRLLDAELKGHFHVLTEREAHGLTRHLVSIFPPRYRRR